MLRTRSHLQSIVMGPFDAFCYVRIVTHDYALHTPDVTPGILPDIDERGAVDAMPVDFLDASSDRLYHFGTAPFSWRSDESADTPGRNNTFVFS